MTDNEIIKALKCCNKPVREHSCTECAFYHSGKCSSNMLNAALDLINRQKAEIEKWKKKANRPFVKVTFGENKLKEIVSDVAKNIEFNLNSVKSEAIKEFAERLKENCYTYSDICGYQSTVVDVNQIDNIAKEMMEELKNDDTKNNISTFDGNRSIR